MSIMAATTQAARNQPTTEMLRMHTAPRRCSSCQGHPLRIGQGRKLSAPEN
jgi:hypothetical protein